MVLEWPKQWDFAYQDAMLRNPDGTHGVMFTLCDQPSCHRRGRFKLLIEVLPGRFHHAWGCFDDQDMPVRYYHDEQRAKAEAESIATVFVSEFCAARIRPCPTTP